MRELKSREIDAVSGGIDFIGSVATGSALGATSYGGLVLAAGYGVETITSAFAAGGAVGGLAGALCYGSYRFATFLGAGTLGGYIGTDLALAMAD